jgi:hypothetical protein
MMELLLRQCCIVPGRGLRRVAEWFVTMAKWTIAVGKPVFLRMPNTSILTALRAQSGFFLASAGAREGQQHLLGRRHRSRDLKRAV